MQHAEALDCSRALLSRAKLEQTTFRFKRAHSSSVREPDTGILDGKDMNHHHADRKSAGLHVGRRERRRSQSHCPNLLHVPL